MLFLTMAVVAEQAALKHSVDEKLIHSIANGSGEAFHTFYEQTKTAVYSFALSILKNPHDAEDVMHDAYLKIHANAGKYVSEGKPMAWVFTITRNLCLMQLRSRSKDDVEYSDEIGLVNPRDFAKDIDDAHLIALMMKLLTDDERQIVVMHAVSGLKHREIAAFLEIPLSTVLSKYNRSLQKLCRHFDKKECLE